MPKRCVNDVRCGVFLNSDEMSEAALPDDGDAAGRRCIMVSLDRSAWGKPAAHQKERATRWLQPVGGAENKQERGEFPAVGRRPVRRWFVVRAAHFGSAGAVVVPRGRRRSLANKRNLIYSFLETKYGSRFIYARYDYYCYFTRLKLSSS